MIIVIIIIIIIIIIGVVVVVVPDFELSSPVLANSFSLEFEWQKVSSSLQDSSQYSERSQQRGSLDGQKSFFNFQLFQSLIQSFVDCTKRNNYKWYNCHFIFHSFFFISLVISKYFSLPFNFTLWSTRTAKFTILQVPSFYLLWLSLFIWLRFGDPFVYQNPWGVFVSHSTGQVMGCGCAIFSYGQTSISLHYSRWITLPTQSCQRLLLFLRYFSTFAYYDIDSFVFIIR